jgi:hypothetical protein
MPESNKGRAMPPPGHSTRALEAHAPQTLCSSHLAYQSRQSFSFTWRAAPHPDARGAEPFMLLSAKEGILGSHAAALL